MCKINWFVVPSKCATKMCNDVLLVSTILYGTITCVLSIVPADIYFFTSLFFYIFLFFRSSLPQREERRQKQFRASMQKAWKAVVRDIFARYYFFLACTFVPLTHLFVNIVYFSGFTINMYRQQQKIKRKKNIILKLNF